MIQGALGNIKRDFLLRDWITQQKMEAKKKKSAISSHKTNDGEPEHYC